MVTPLSMPAEKHEGGEPLPGEAQERGPQRGPGEAQERRGPEEAERGLSCPEDDRPGTAILVQGASEARASATWPEGPLPKHLGPPPSAQHGPADP